MDPFRTSFVGRTTVIESLRGLLASDARVVTLTGAPGVGKSRIAHRIAQLSSHVLIDCSVSDEEEIFARFDAAMAEPSATAVVLDNVGDRFDAIVEALASRTSLRAKVMTTSRRALRIPGEVVLEIEPLEVPREEARTVEALAASEAGQLFLDRAGLGGTLSDRDAAPIAEIIRRVGGNPLAIELAAGRCRVLAPAALLSRLEQSLDVLGGGPRGRHESLRRAIETSLEGLTPVERDAIEQLSVFRSAFTLPSAEVVVQLPDGSPPLVDSIQSLVDKGLLRSSLSAPPAEVRMSFDVNVRRYCSEQRERRADRDAIAQRLGRHYTQYSHELVAPARATDIRGVIEKIGADVENMVGALETAMETGVLRDLTGVRDGALILGRPMTGRPKLGSSTLLRAAALEVASDEAVADETCRRAAVLRLVGVALGCVGRNERARTSFERALPVTDAIADRETAGRWRARVACCLGALCAVMRDFTAAEHWFLEAHAAVPAAQRGALLPDVLGHHANALLFAGRPKEALARYREAETAASADDPRRPLISFSIGVASMDLGALDEGASVLEEVVAAHEATGDEISLAGALALLGALEHERGELEVAEGHYRRAVEGLRSARVPRAETSVLAKLGVLYVAMGRDEDANRAFAEGKVRSLQAGDRGAATSLRLALAALDLRVAREALGRGDTDEARRLRREALARVEDAPAMLDPLERQPPTFATLDQDDDHRFLKRVLRRELERDAFLIADDGSCFRLPTGEVAVVPQTRFARLLAILAESRVAVPGTGEITFEELVDRLWPGEKMTQASAQNRLQVSLSSLRSLGLRELLQRTDKGYRLDPAHPVLVRPASEVGAAQAIKRTTRLGSSK